MMLSAGSLALTNLMGGVRYLSANWLHIRLLEIFGSSLIGLWIGEDLVTSGTDVTSWPGRVGPILTYGANSQTRKFSRVFDGKFAVKDTVGYTANTVVLVASGAAVPGVQSLWTVYTSPNTHPLHQSVLTGAQTNAGLVVNQNTNSWWNFGTARYVNGILTNAFTPSAKAISECDISTSGIWLGGRDSTTTDGTTIPGSLFFGMALSAIPTVAQRILATIALKQYYGITVSASDLLARDLLRNEGSNVTGLWILDDAVIDGAEAITSLPSRAGGNMVNQYAGLLPSGTVNGRRCTIQSAEDAQRALIATIPSSSSLLTVAEINEKPATVTYRGVVSHISNLTCNITTNGNNFAPHASYSYYTNGVSKGTSGDLLLNTPAVYENDTGFTTTSVFIGAHSTTTFLRGRQWLVMTRAAAPTTAQRNATYAILKSYYSLP